MDSSIDYAFESMCLSIIKDQVLLLTEEYSCKVFLFGSRANGTFRRGSDFDIGIKGLSKDEFLRVRDEFSLFWEDSIVPYKLDLVNFDIVKDEFKEVALREIVVWKND